MRFKVARAASFVLAFAVAAFQTWSLGGHAARASGVSDAAFIDAGDHYTRGGYPDGTDEVGSELGAVIAEIEERQHDAVQ